MKRDNSQKELFGAIQHIVKTEIQNSHGELLEAVEGLGEAVQELASNMDHRFNAVDYRFDHVESRLTRVESSMVTKAYLDDKLAEEGARYGGHIRQTNEKVHALADALVAEKSLSAPAASRIRLMTPFPRRSAR